jgi:signal transduction histidine kinase
VSTQPHEKVPILLVDDQPEGLMALEATLAPLGQQLVTARSGREALRHLLHQDFAVVLLDVVMPEMDDFETAQLIREREKSRHTPILVDQVVTNLLTNALKYGAGAPVELSVREEAAHATLEVRDHGIGIKEQDRHRIFECFERAVPHEHYSGFGLGLWIVHEIITSLGGTVTVDSHPDKGALFRVQLPWNSESQATEWRQAAQG